MEAHEVRYFLAVARVLNFTKAAVACSVTQPALTRAIKKLESEIGGLLFHRQPSGITLTNLGRSLLPRLEEIDNGFERVRREAEALTKESPNRLRLGVMCTVGPAHIVSILGKLRERLPELSVTIQDARADRVVEHLLADEIDVAITAQPSFPEALHALPLFVERYAVAFIEGHPFSERPSVDVEAVAGQAYLERLSCEFDQHYEARPDAVDYEFDVRYASEREDWIQALILAGEGCAILPEFMDCLPGIEKRPISQPEMRRTVCAATLRGRPLSDAAKAFIRLAGSHNWIGMR